MGEFPEIKCIFFSEFHHTAGPRIAYQVPEDYITKEDFDTLHVYIITKPQFKDKIITVNALGHKIVGCPAYIEDPRYARNALVFNLCLVFDSAADTLKHEIVVKKLAGYLTNLEIHSEFLSNEANKEKLPCLLQQIREEVNQLGTCCIKIDQSTTIHLRVTDNSREPPNVSDHDVPILIPDSKAISAICKWDMGTQQLLPYIDGFKHVALIAVEADVEITIVKSCICNLVFYGAVKLISIFQRGDRLYDVYRRQILMTKVDPRAYSNVYVTTSLLHRLVRDKCSQEECIQYVSRPGKYAMFQDVFELYCGLKAGTTVKDLCARINPHGRAVDERKLVQYGLMRGFVRRLFKYPVKLPNEAGSSRLKHIYRWLNGNHSFDEICSKTGSTYQELNEKIENDSSIVVIWK